MRVEEGGAALLTEQHLLVRDQDTRGEGLRAELQATPLHGHLELQGRVLRRGEGFSLQDLKELRVRSGVKGQMGSLSMGSDGTWRNFFNVFDSSYWGNHHDQLSQDVQCCGGGA